MRICTALVLATACLAQQPGDLRALVQDSLRFVESNPMDGFNYSWRSYRKQFDSAGKVTSETTLTGEKITIDGIPVRRLLERDGQKLSEEEAQQQELKIREAVERHRSNRRKPEDNQWVKEVGEALVFQLTGEERVDGRPAWVLNCSPRPGYAAKNMRAKVFAKMNGKLRIDKADRELVHAEAETFDTVHVGFGFLGKVEKGTRFLLARTRLPDGSWVLDSQNIRFGARVMLVKWIGSEMQTRHWNYRRQ